MSPTHRLINIVADFVTPGGGREHARALRSLLSEHAYIICWSEEPLPASLTNEVRVIRPYSKEYPRGGTLIILGPQRKLLPWVEHCRANRIILVCNASEPAHLFRQIACIRDTNLPEPEISYVSDRLRLSIGIPGEVNISPMNVEEMEVVAPSHERLTVGRHSRDIPEKHHPLDISLYRQLVLNGLDVRIMGGSCLSPLAQPTPEGLELLPFGHKAPKDFLAELDIFFYRTSPQFHEPSGRSILEAMAAGIPIVAMTSGGYTDWIKNGESGFLITNQDEAFDRLMELGQSATLRKKLGTGARDAELLLSGKAARREVANWYLFGVRNPINA